MLSDDADYRARHAIVKLARHTYLQVRDMYNTQALWQGRCKQFGGRFCRLWGRLTRNPAREFRGEQMIIAGKLESYYAGASGDRRASRISSFIERRRVFHVVV